MIYSYNNQLDELTYLLHGVEYFLRRFAASQEIPRISRNPKVHYCTHKRPPPVSILGQPNPVHIPTSHLLEIRPVSFYERETCLAKKTFIGVESTAFAFLDH